MKTSPTTNSADLPTFARRRPSVATPITGATVTITLPMAYSAVRKHHSASPEPFPDRTGNKDHQQGRDGRDLARHVCLRIRCVQILQHVVEDKVETRRKGEQSDRCDPRPQHDPALGIVELLR